MNNIYKYEEEIYKQGYEYIAGADEVGRGPMAGPLVAAAVILPKGIKIEGLNDSKKLTEKKRESLFEEILKKAVEVQIKFISVEDVDKYNVLESSRMAMTSCIKSMKSKVDYILTDAMKLPLNIPTLDLIKGDSKSASIAAASIIAKVSRDRYMVMLDKEFPQYGFKNHKGYVTKQHKEALEKFGICIHHRKTFAPVSKYL